MALNTTPNNINENPDYRRLLRILKELDYKTRKVDLSNTIIAFEKYKKFTPKQAVWFYKFAKKWFYTESDLSMNGFINLNLDFSKDSILTMSDEDFNILEIHLSEDERKRVYAWVRYEYRL